jgi:hypothetical protein
MVSRRQIMVKSVINYFRRGLTMSFDGVIVNGMVVLEGNQKLPEGLRVQVVVPETEPTLSFLLKYAGASNDLPPDMAEQHDHYIHGTPKR